MGRKNTTPITTPEEKETLIYEKKSNLAIFNESYELIKTCVEFQFAKLCKLDPGRKQFKNDLLQDLCVWILTYDNERLNDAYHKKHINALCTRIIQNQIFSASSNFYRKYIDFDRRALWDTGEYIRRREATDETEGEEED